MNQTWFLLRLRILPQSLTKQNKKKTTKKHSIIATFFEINSCAMSENPIVISFNMFNIDAPTDPPGTGVLLLILGCSNACEDVEPADGDRLLLWLNQAAFTSESSSSFSNGWLVRVSVLIVIFNRVFNVEVPFIPCVWMVVAGLWLLAITAVGAASRDVVSGSVGILYDSSYLAFVSKD